MTIRRPVGSSGAGGLVLESQLPHLIGMDEDILNTGIFIYNIKVIFCFTFPLQKRLLIARYLFESYE